MFLPHFKWFIIICLYSWILIENSETVGCVKFIAMIMKFSSWTSASRLLGKFDTMNQDVVSLDTKHQIPNDFISQEFPTPICFCAKFHHDPRTKNSKSTHIPLNITSISLPPWNYIVYVNGSFQQTNVMRFSNCIIAIRRNIPFMFRWKRHDAVK